MHTGAVVIDMAPCGLIISSSKLKIDQHYRECSATRELVLFVTHERKWRMIACACQVERTDSLSCQCVVPISIEGRWTVLCTEIYCFPSIIIVNETFSKLQDDKMTMIHLHTHTNCVIFNPLANMMYNRHICIICEQAQTDCIIYPLNKKRKLHFTKFDVHSHETNVPTQMYFCIEILSSHSSPYTRLVMWIDCCKN